MCPLTEKDKRLRVKIREVPVRRDSGETRSCSDGQGLLNKSIIQFSVDGRGCVLSLLFDLRPNYGGIKVNP